jgi:proteasome lid subunit RPN8/RPN11
MRLTQAPRELRIKRDDLASILRHGREESPLESCGLMIGRREGSSCFCDHILPAENVDRSPCSFTIAPEELLKGYRHADSIGMELVGIYHSHPARPSPSQVDIGFMKWSAPVWLIVSSLNWEYAAFRLDGERPAKVAITLL